MMKAGTECLNYPEPYALPCQLSMLQTAHFPLVLRFLRKAGISTAGVTGTSLALGVALYAISSFDLFATVSSTNHARR